GTGGGCVHTRANSFRPLTWEFRAKRSNRSMPPEIASPTSPHRWPEARRTATSIPTAAVRERPGEGTGRADKESDREDEAGRRAVRQQLAGGIGQPALGRGDAR